MSEVFCFQTLCVAMDIVPADVNRSMGYSLHSCIAVPIEDIAVNQHRAIKWFGFDIHETAATTSHQDNEG